MPKTELHKTNVRLSEGQKNSLARAYRDRYSEVLRLKRDALTGNDTLLVPASVVQRLERNRASGRGMEIRLAKANIRKQVGSGIFSAVGPLVKGFGPTLAKTLGLAALPGTAYEGNSQIVKKISGGGQKVGFIVSHKNTDKPTDNHQLKSKNETYSMPCRPVVTSPSNQQHSKWVVVWGRF